MRLYDPDANGTQERSVVVRAVVGTRLTHSKNVCRCLVCFLQISQFPTFVALAVAYSSCCTTQSWYGYIRCLKYFALTSFKQIFTLFNFINTFNFNCMNFVCCLISSLPCLFCKFNKYKRRVLLWLKMNWNISQFNWPVN